MSKEKNYELKIYDKFDYDLSNKWKDFYTVTGGNYNTSFEWCNIWFKYFGENKKLHIVTIWDNDELKLLAPFYIKKDRLYLIGSNPDLYDEFDILFQDIKYAKKLIEYIFDNNLKVDFKFVNPESEFIKLLLEKLMNITDFSKIIYEYTVKPVVYSNKEFKKSTKEYVKRRKNISKREYGQLPDLEFNLEKKTEYLDELVHMHKKKWGFFNKKKFEPFIRDLFFNTDIVIFSRLYLPENDSTLAYAFGFKDSRQNQSLMLPSFDTKFAKISPGIIILHDLILESFNRKFISYDLGKGAMDYKYDFANKNVILINIKTNNTWKRWKALYFPLKSAKNSILTKLGRV